MNPVAATGWLKLVADLVQNPGALLLTLALLLMLFSWLVVRFYQRDQACQQQAAKLETMLAYVWGLLGQDPRFAGRLPSFQAVKSGSIDLDQWMRDSVWHRGPWDAPERRYGYAPTNPASPDSRP